MKYCPECGKKVQCIDTKHNTDVTINRYICDLSVHWWEEKLDNYGGPTVIKEVN